MVKKKLSSLNLISSTFYFTFNLNSYQTVPAKCLV